MSFFPLEMTSFLNKNPPSEDGSPSAGHIFCLRFWYPKWYLREFQPLSGLRAHSPFLLLPSRALQLSPDVLVNARFLYDKGAMRVAVNKQ